MKRFIPLCLCAAMLFGLASCRGVAERPFDVSDFVPHGATVTDRSAGHAVVELQGATLQQVVEFYELRLAFVNSQQIRLNDAEENFWDYTGIYGEKHVIKITIRATGDTVRVLINYLDEMRQR